MLWVKAFHVIFMICWFAGLFYLPRLFVYHALAEDDISQERFKIMERKLYYGIMMPSAILTIGLGLWMLFAYAWQAYQSQLWIHVKLGLIWLLLIFHIYCGYLRKQFERNQNTHSHLFYRYLNEIPVIILIAIVILTIVKPF